MDADVGKRTWKVTQFLESETMILWSYKNVPLEHSHMFLMFIELWQIDRERETDQRECACVGGGGEIRGWGRVIPLKLIGTDSTESLSQHNQK